MAFIGAEHSESELQEAQQLTGAILVAEGLHELRLIRKLLTPAR